MSKADIRKEKKNMRLKLTFRLLSFLGCVFICILWLVEQQQTGKKPYGLSAAKAHLTTKTDY